MSQIVRFANNQVTLNGLWIPFDSPGKLFDRDGQNITGPAVEVDLDTGRVVYRIALLDRFSPTKKRDRTVNYAPPLKLVDAIGRSWLGRKE